ncbi:MAG: GNAT family N-acetyltransferase [Candidatus Bathyarchaeota archaeon]|nr:GNAT family N-acetyltransferase [Candidatus Bathyarchaeota archaeon]
MLKVYSHADAEAKPFLSQVSKYTEMAELMKLPFWIFTEGSNPIGIVTVGKEPLQMLAPIGTPIAVIDLIQKDQQSRALKNFASQSLKLALENDAEIATVELVSEEKNAVDSFLGVDFKVLADTLTMTLQLDREFDSPEGLELRLAQREEMPKWIKAASKFLSGSADTVMERILKQLSDFPENLLDMYYSMETFYFASVNKHEVGILNFSPRAGRISNVGVKPSRRGQGHGREIVLFGLKQLKTAGCKQAKLRVHVDNKRALALYKSLGFEVSGRRKFLIWGDEKA